MKRAETPGLGATVGPYRLVRRLGGGGMGEVFLASDQRLGREVALKRVLPRHGAAEFRERFRREAWAVARLSHPAVVRVFDLVEGDGEDWLVLEYVAGPTLREVLRREGPPPLARALAWAEQVAAGLAAAHEQGLVHRDLKAENVMLTATGAVKIVDFGVAKPFGHLGQALYHGLESAPGLVIGTLHTMAPEQARGQQVDARADLFSLGVLLYELLTGRLPFQGASTPELLRAVALEPHQAVRAAAPAVPPPVAALVDRLLAKAPEARPATAAAVASDLRRLQAGLARPVTTPAPVRRRVGAGAAALVLGAALLVQAPAPADGSCRHAAACLERGSARLARWDQPGEVPLAIVDLERANTLAPRSAPVLAALSRAYWRQGRAANRDRGLFQAARKAAAEATSLDGRLVEAHLSLALAAIDLGDLAGAEVALDRAAALQPHQPTVAQARGNLALARGDLTGAAAAFEEALRRADVAELHNALGAVYYRQKQYLAAEAAFRRAIERAPNAIHGYRNRAAALQALGQVDAAAAALQRAIEIAPSPSLYSNLGTLLFYQGQYVAANAAYTRALDAARREGSSHLGVLWANLADSHRFLPTGAAAARGAYGQAVRWTRVEVANRPGDAEPQSRLALYLARLGRVEEARQELTATLALPQLDLSARLRVVQTHELLGERRAALGALAAALGAGLPLADVEREPDLAPLRADPAFGSLRAAPRG